MNEEYDKIINDLLAGKNSNEAAKQVADGEITNDLSVVAVKLDADGTVHSASAGQTELGPEGQAPTPDTLFRIGSATKSFGAATILHLAEKGVFGEKGIDEKLHDHIDEWADKIEEKYKDTPNVEIFRRLLKENTHEDATIRDALGHTSGMGNAHRAFPLDEAEGREIGFRYLEQKDTEKKEGFEYSNPMYIALGMIIEAATDKNLEDVIREEVIDRYNLENTFTTGEFKSLQPEEKEKFSKAQSYWDIKDDGNTLPMLEFDYDGMAGNMISSPKDLAKFYQAVINDPVLQPMQESNEHESERWGKIGLGSFTDIEWQGQKWIGHTGAGGPGAVAAAVYANPETGEVVALTATRFVGVETNTVHGQMSYEQTLVSEEKDKQVPIIESGIKQALEENNIPLNASEVTLEHFNDSKVKMIDVRSSLKEKMDTDLNKENSQQQVLESGEKILTPQDLTKILMQEASNPKANASHLQETLSQYFGDGLVTSPLAVSATINKPGQEPISSAQTGITALGDRAQDVDADTLFNNVMSISKTFTGALLTRMSEGGKIDLDAKLHDKVDEYAKKLKEKYDIPEEHETVFEKIIKKAAHPDATIRDLARHTAGIPRNDHLLEGSEADVQKGPFKYLAINEAALEERGGNEQKPDFNYSNMGYRLLGMVIEAEDDKGRNFSQMIREEILEKYNLEHTMTAQEWSEMKPEERPLVADWYATDMVTHKDYKAATEIERFKDFSGAEGMLSTPLDLTNFLNEIKKDGTLDKMLPELQDGKTYSYGIGVAIKEHAGELWAGGHEGGGVAVSTDVEMNLRTGDVISFTQTHIEGLSLPLLFERHALLDVKPQGVSIKLSRDEIPEVKAFMEERMPEILDQHGLEKEVRKIKPEELENYLPAIDQMKKEVDGFINEMRRDDLPHLQHEYNITKRATETPEKEPAIVQSQEVTSHEAKPVLDYEQGMNPGSSQNVEKDGILNYEQGMNPKAPQHHKEPREIGLNVNIDKEELSSLGKTLKGMEESNHLGSKKPTDLEIKQVNPSQKFIH